MMRFFFAVRKQLVALILRISQSLASFSTNGDEVGRTWVLFIRENIRLCDKKQIRPKSLVMVFVALSTGNEIRSIQCLIRFPRDKRTSGGPPQLETFGIPA